MLSVIFFDNKMYNCSVCHYIVKVDQLIRELNLFNIIMTDLTEDQLRVFNKFLDGESIFITGPGGCGKSFLIESIKKSCIERNRIIGITALTGTAASLIGGQTLHGWSGIGLAKEPADVIVRKIYTRKDTYKKWKDVNVLVIDEVSMMSAELFNKLNSIGQKLRKDDRFYGGIQMVFCGDFAQLEPIGSIKFCFETTEWKKHLDQNTYYMTKIMRQKDIVFQKILMDIRLGIVTPEARKILNSRLITEESEANIAVEGTDQFIKATVLYPLKKDVTRINISELEKLKDQGCITKTFLSDDYITDKKNQINIAQQMHIEQLDKCISVGSSLELVVGAQVMLTKNIDVSAGLVNGSRGVVIDFNTGFPRVVFDSGQDMTVTPLVFSVEYGSVTINRKQIPLSLAWAITIHKSQGASLTEVITDLSDTFGNGQAYVTLSRVRSLDGLFLVGINYDKIKCNKVVKKYYESLSCKKDTMQIR